MGYRYDLTEFDYYEDFSNFINNTLQDEEQYYISHMRKMSGREIKNNAEALLSMGDIFSIGYIDSISSLQKVYSGLINDISQFVNSIFTASFNWNDSLHIIDAFQSVLTVSERFLPDVQGLSDVFRAILSDMEANDVYAFADRMLIIETHFKALLHYLNRDSEFFLEQGVYNETSSY